MRRIKRFYFTLSLLTASLIPAACSPASQVPDAASQTVPVEAATPTPYSVSVTESDFVAEVNNPYYPLLPGSHWVYEARFEDGTTERNELEILDEKRLVNGAEATVLYDTVFVDGEMVEETHDWFAQDRDGNVWYLGEEVNNFEDGVLVDHSGSWEWGVDGALPGVIMWADPAAHLGEAYFQEYFPGEAEDMGQVLSASERLEVPAGIYEGVLQTYDYSSLDPNLQEHKFYAAGIGLIKEIDLLTGEEVVLLEFTFP